ncbi:MAG: beta-ketoacyl-ACP synthase II [Chloroflexi bacterium]|nr:beta-ketoacyl-ACP synthase II [Chloroflexota bacterium]
MLGKRVVITGMGALTPVGNDVESSWSNLIAGKSGIGPITRFDSAGFDARIAGEVKDFDPAQFINFKEAKRMDRFVHFALTATFQAMADAGFKVTPENADNVGVLIGSGIGGIGTLTEQMVVLQQRGPSRISPFLVPMMIIDMASGQVSISIGAKGPNLGVVSACATGADALAMAAGIIRRGEADVMIAGGTEAPVVPISLAGFASMRALSTRNDEPEKASRPFDAGRDGFVIGEGAAVFVMESLEHALGRGAHIYAELAGHGGTGDAYHITAPAAGGEGGARAMALAIERAGLHPEDIDYVNAHGTSTPLNDKSETAAIKSVFGQHAYSVPVSSTKSMTGHLLGAAGAVEAMVTVLAINRGVIPPTINYETPDPECDLDYVPNEARQKDVRVAVSNVFGFGGHNVVLVFRRFEE